MPFQRYDPNSAYENTGVTAPASNPVNTATRNYSSSGTSNNLSSSNVWAYARNAISSQLDKIENAKKTWDDWLNDNNSDNESQPNPVYAPTPEPEVEATAEPEIIEAPKPQQKKAEEPVETPAVETAVNPVNTPKPEEIQPVVTPVVRTERTVTANQAPKGEAETEFYTSSNRGEEEESESNSDKNPVYPQYTPNQTLANNYVSGSGLMNGLTGINFRSPLANNLYQNPSRTYTGVTPPENIQASNDYLAQVGRAANAAIIAPAWQAMVNNNNDMQNDPRALNTFTQGVRLANPVLGLLDAGINLGNAIGGVANNMRTAEQLTNQVNSGEITAGEAQAQFAEGNGNPVAETQRIMENFNGILSPGANANPVNLDLAMANQQDQRRQQALENVNQMNPFNPPVSMGELRAEANMLPYNRPASPGELRAEAQAPQVSANPLNRVERSIYDLLPDTLTTAQKQEYAQYAQRLISQLPNDMSAQDRTNFISGLIRGAEQRYGYGYVPASTGGMPEEDAVPELLEDGNYNTALDRILRDNSIMRDENGNVVYDKDGNPLETHTYTNMDILNLYADPSYKGDGLSHPENGGIGYRGVTIPDDVKEIMASTLYYAAGQGEQAETVEMTATKFNELAEKFMEANPTLKLLVDQGRLTLEDIGNFFFKKIKTTGGSRGYSGGGYGRYYGGGGGGRGYYGGGGSSSYRPNPTQANQRQSRIYNIMKNWSF